MDITNNLVEMKDMWMGYTEYENSLIRVGNHKAPRPRDAGVVEEHHVGGTGPYIDAWAPNRLMGLS